MSGFAHHESKSGLCKQERAVRDITRAPESGFVWKRRLPFRNRCAVNFQRPPPTTLCTTSRTLAMNQPGDKPCERHDYEREEPGRQRERERKQVVTPSGSCRSPHRIRICFNSFFISRLLFSFTLSALSLWSHLSITVAQSFGVRDSRHGNRTGTGTSVFWKRKVIGHLSLEKQNKTQLSTLFLRHFSTAIILLDSLNTTVRCRCRRYARSRCCLFVERILLVELASATIVDPINVCFSVVNVAECCRSMFHVHYLSLKKVSASYRFFAFCNYKRNLTFKTDRMTFNLFDRIASFFLRFTILRALSSRYRNWRLSASRNARTTNTKFVRSTTFIIIDVTLTLFSASKLSFLLQFFFFFLLSYPGRFGHGRTMTNSFFRTRFDHARPIVRCFGKNRSDCVVQTIESLMDKRGRFVIQSSEFGHCPERAPFQLWNTFFRLPSSFEWFQIEFQVESQWKTKTNDLKFKWNDLFELSLFKNQV